MLFISNVNGSIVNNSSLDHLNYQPVITVPELDYNVLNNLNAQTNIQNLSKLIEIKDEISLLKMVKLPYKSSFSNLHPTEHSDQVSQSSIAKRIKKQKKENIASSNNLKNIFSIIELDLEKSDNKRLNNKLNNLDRVNAFSEASSGERNDESSNKLENKNKNEFNLDSNEDELSPSLVRSSNKTSDYLNSNNKSSNNQFEFFFHPNNQNSNSSSFSSSSSNSILFESSSTSAKSSFKTFSSLNYEQPALISTRHSPSLYSLSLTNQLNPTFDLFNTSPAKLPIKSIFINKNETLFNPQQITMPLVNSSSLNLVSSNKDYEYPSYIRNSATAIFAIIFLFGTVGNFLVAFIIFRSKELRNTTNYFLINLSIADLLVIIVCMPTVLIELHSKPEIWLLGYGKTIPYVEMSVAHASILTMLAISFERWYAICKPLKVSYKCTKLRAVLIILSIWVIALFSTLPLLFIAKQGTATYLDGNDVPVCLTQANDVYSKAFFLVIIALFFFFPLIILVIIYVIITKKLCAKENISYAESVQMRARRQVVIMLATVIVCFFICLLPFRLFTLFLLFVSAQTIQSIGMETYYVYLYTSRVMLYLNSALNPLLYNLISSKFRNAFVQILCCRSISGVNRMLVRQSTFNTTTTAISLTGISGFINNNFNNSSDLDASNSSSKYKRMQTCSLKQSHSMDTNLKQMSYKQNRQSSLQQFSSTGTDLLKTKDENDNKINNDQFSPSKRLIRQSSFIKHDDNELDQCNSNDRKLSDKKSIESSETKDLQNKSNGKSHSEMINEYSNEINLNENRQNTVNCELKVLALQKDISNLSSNDTMNLELNEKRKLNFKFYQQIKNRLFKKSRPNDRYSTDCHNKTNGKSNNEESIIDEVRINQTDSNESNV